MTDRSEYTRGELTEASVLASPFEQLQLWLDEARAAKVIEPTAMCVSTVGPDGRPSARFVLLRGLDSQGLVFFTNYSSRKGQDLALHPFACATFWWGDLERQVRIEGRVERTTDAESGAYFLSRPADSRLASAASPQSTVVTNREELETMVDELAARYGDDIPRPNHWGGFRIVPDRFEFWQGRKARLHDRIVFRLQDGHWVTERLAP